MSIIWRQDGPQSPVALARALAHDSDLCVVYCDDAATRPQYEAWAGACFVHACPPTRDALVRIKVLMMARSPVNITKVTVVMDCDLAEPSFEFVQHLLLDGRAMNIALVLVAPKEVLDHDRWGRILRPEMAIHPRDVDCTKAYQMSHATTRFCVKYGMSGVSYS